MPSQPVSERLHTAITKHFKNYHLFGFTGTPIFAVNAKNRWLPHLRTTGQAFGDCLHSYTVVDAIKDGNVLPFRIGYVDTVRRKEDVRDEQVYGIDAAKALSDPRRVSAVASYVLDHFDQKTKRQSSYILKDRRVRGFNSLFAADSIGMAKQYYAEFQCLQAERGGEPLKIALIYSFAPNEADPGEQGFIDDEDFETAGLDQSSRDFLDAAICDYNRMFGSSFSTAPDQFENYYKDLCLRLKNRDLDMSIVVNMLLTGFDATTLNTLWVDKNLKQHGLMQAFSRTNRILNSVKTFGNIVCFRDLRQEVDDALALFGDKDAKGTVVLKPYAEYLAAYTEKVSQLLKQFPLGEEIVGEQAQKDFLTLFGSILRLRNILQAFDDFSNDDVLSLRDLQDYQSLYIDLYQQRRSHEEADKEIINDDVVFEAELVKQIEVNIDYILELVAKYHDGHMEDKSILADISRTIMSSPDLRSKKGPHRLVRRVPVLRHGRAARLEGIHRPQEAGGVRAHCQRGAPEDGTGRAVHHRLLQGRLCRHGRHQNSVDAAPCVTLRAEQRVRADEEPSRRTVPPILRSLRRNVRERLSLGTKRRGGEF